MDPGRNLRKDGRRPVLVLSLSLSFLFTTCRAQAAFEWAFVNNSLAVSSPVITQCQTYSLKVFNTTNNVGALGVPPYYISAFQSNGHPTTSLLGSDANNLSWTVDMASGSSLLLTVVDSAGNAGGVDPPIYTVGAGSNADCLPATPSESFVLSTNVSSTVQTCEPMGFQINGSGQKPYTISIVIANSPVVSNVTLGANDDQFTYTNHADTNGHLVVAVSEAKGVWGMSSDLYTSVASTKFSCVGSVSSSDGTSSSSLPISSPAATQTSSSSPSATSSVNSNHTPIIVAVIASICGTGLLVLLAFCFRRWRSRRALEDRRAEPAFMPDAWYNPVPASIPGGYSDIGATSSSSLYDPPPQTSAPSSKLARPHALDASASFASGGSAPALLGVGFRQGPPRPGSSVYDSASSSIAAHVGYNAVTPQTDSSTPSGSWSKSPSQYRPPPGVPPEWNVEPHIVIQHEDAGGVQEIPPPYRAPDAGAGASYSNKVHTAGE